MKLDYTFDRQLMLEREDSREEGRVKIKLLVVSTLIVSAYFIPITKS